MKKRKITINKKAKKEIERYPLVEIKWLDIVSDSSWLSCKDLSKMSLPVCVTKGHLYSTSKGITRVFADYNLVNAELGTIEDVSQVTVIPNSVIVEIKKL
jgi:hypothetical protein